MKKPLVFIVLLFSFTMFCQEKYSIEYETDAEGKRISGSIEQLIEEVRKGNPVRVGWTLTIQDKEVIKTLEHWTDSKFLTIIDEQVYAQIHSIYAQMTSFNDEEGKMYFVDNTPNAWVAIISTTGMMRMKNADEHMVFEDMSDEEIAKITQMLENQMVATKWAVPVD